jgi:hypothetical protein
MRARLLEVFGAPQGGSTLQAYVVTYYTGTLPSI